MSVLGGTQVDLHIIGRRWKAPGILLHLGELLGPGEHVHAGPELGTVDQHASRNSLGEQGWRAFRKILSATI
jgi:hypothetical protein